MITIPAIAYDYETQQWVSGVQGAVLRRQQLQDELELLQGSKGAEYARFVNFDRSEAIRCAQLELNRLETV